MTTLGRQLAIASVGLVAATSIVVVRLLLEARSAYRQGTYAEERGQTGEAIRHYLDAGRAYLPGNPTVTRALDRLDAIGVASVTKGDYATARAAFEAERAALLGSRSFYLPHADRLPTLDRRLARLLAASEDPSGGPSFEERTAWHEQRLIPRQRPKTALVIMGLLGFALWVGSGVAFFRSGLGKDLVLSRAPALLAGVGFLIGLALFLVCLRLA